ncbi:MAG: hypothetical protein ABJA37_04725 [Ferruginibacter sp.]
MSESIHAGYLPLWNPYINYGFPQYGDMSSGFWSPITWLVAATVGYNAYSFTLEIFFYLLLGAAGVYQLTRLLQLNKSVCLIAGISFMCCGFNVGHLQHFNWISGAAFLPWCIWSYLLLLQNSSLKNILLNALFFYFFIASAHPGIIISSFYFFTALLVFYFFYADKGLLSIKQRLKKIALSHSLLVLCLLLLSAGLIAGYADIIPYFLRGEKISLENSLSGATGFSSWISMLLPFTTVKNAALFDTDISMRNCYIGITLAIFFFTAVFRKKNNWQKFLFGAGLLFALLSTGGIFKIFAYKFIPFIGYVRLNGEFTIFALLCFILIAAIELNKFLAAKEKFINTVKWITNLLQFVIGCLVIYSFIKIFTTKESFLFQWQNITIQKGVTLKLKSLIDAIGFFDTIIIQGCIQLVLIQSLKYSLKLQRYSLLKKIVVVDMVLACLLNVPFTGAGQASVAQLQHVLNKSPKGIPIPVLHPIKNNDTLNFEEKHLLGDWSMYNKQIGTGEEVPYPIILKNMRHYFEQLKKDTGNEALNKAVFFIQDENTNNRISITRYTANQIDISAYSTTVSKIIIQQNWYPHWFYGPEKKQVLQAGINFISIPVAKGQNKITVKFEPKLIRYAMLFSAVFFLAFLALFFILKSKPVLTTTLSDL